MKISQVAIWVSRHTLEATKAQLNHTFARDLEFYEDSLVMDGEIDGRNPISSVDLHLTFSHLLGDGFELEFISSTDHDHWHYTRGYIVENNHNPFLSHLGAYVSERELLATKSVLTGQNVSILQDTVSRDHTNKREDGTARSYRDLIFDSRQMFGFNLKLSARVE